MTATKILTLITLTGIALMAGLFFGYGNSVMPSLEQLPAGQGAAAMNLMNVAIYNPLFLMIFTVTGLACLPLILLGFVQRHPGRWWLLAGSLLYFVAGMITMSINVPLNDQLATLDPYSPEGLAEWTSFAGAWSTANNLRAIACTLSVITLGVALASSTRPRPVGPLPANPYQYPGTVPPR
ncbi:DUF1772 domain-containing protein [Microlunatus speluncae]|uniref:anthrone oxygenase family protein n=1 Tax=Microlunatus speluncae TaxID=2594267 RepID=UPI0012663ED0|nr:anthrone oxygenase family protein [Microlunatus speluncae]